MRTLMKIVAVAGALLCSAAAAQADQQDSTEAGTSYSASTGAYAYGGDFYGGYAYGGDGYRDRRGYGYGDRRGYRRW